MTRNPWKDVAKGTQENRNETNILSQGPPSEPSSEPPDNEPPRNDMRYHQVGVGPTNWNKLLGRSQVAILKRWAASETTHQYNKHLDHDAEYIYIDDP